MKTTPNTACTKSQLAQAYNVSIQTFRRWLLLVPNLQLTDGQRVLTPRQVGQIKAHLGEPE
jgi:hypothetical protein